MGKFQGGLAGITAGDLGAVALKALMARTGLDPERVDDIIFAQGYGNGEAPCIARWSALAADFPITTPGYQLDRRCGSGLQSIIDASMMIATGAADVVIAGGVESMSNAEYYSLDMRGGARQGPVVMHDRLTRGRVMSQPISRFGVISGMIETAENLAKDYNISREACDIYAARSHRRIASRLLPTAAASGLCRRHRLVVVPDPSALSAVAARVERVCVSMQTQKDALSLTHASGPFRAHTAPSSSPADAARSTGLPLS